MATVKDIVSLMEEIAPLELSNNFCKKYNCYDNSGLLLGEEERQVFSVLVCLDITGDVADEAADINADMIITHHPLIYSGIKSITKNDWQGKIIHKLIKNEIAVYAAHLNFDIAPYGVSQIFADKLGLVNCKVIQPIGEEAGLGRIGNLKDDCTLREMFEKVSSLLNENSVKVSGDLDKTINTVAVVCGAGGDIEILKAAESMGADLLITAEIKHHVAIRAKEMGIALLDGGHYATEYPAIEVLTQMICSYAANKNMDIEVTESSIYTNPFI